MKNTLAVVAGMGCVLAGAGAGAQTDIRQTIELQEVIVTGSRLRQRDPEGPSPVLVMDRQKIDELGVSTVSDMLKYVAQQPYYRSENFRNGGEQFVELRGIGVDTTLVLINGRRIVPSAASISSNAFDLNSIPLPAVERVEILSDAASAVYGADAVGGVVNIILKRDVEGATVDLHYGSAQGGAEEQRVSLTMGQSGERMRSSLVLDYLHKDFLLGAERDRWSDQDFRRYGDQDFRSASANPGNITSRSTANLPGLPSRIAAVPEGSTGVGLTPQDFLDTAGQQNLDSLARFSSIVPKTERVNAALFAEFDLLPELTVFAEGMYAERTVERQSSPATLSNTLVPASNAFNPFGVPVSASYLFDGIGPRVGTVESELARGLIGLRGGLGSWDWELTGVVTRESASDRSENATNAARVTQALASSDPSQALNVFQDGPGGSASLLASLVAPATESEYTAKGTQISAFVRGELVSLPAGSIEVAIGGEFRTEDVLHDSTLFVDADREVHAAFAELSVPLVSEQQHCPLVHRLSLKLAGRIDDYSDFGRTDNPQYGLTWMPVQSLTLRASYGTSFRPPSLYELYTPRITAAFSERDPRRNNQQFNAEAITGGNPDLRPIEGDSFVAGLVWAPSSVQGLRFEASWWDIQLDERIAVIPVQRVLQYESSMPERVVRADPSPADIAAGWPGPILSVNISRDNVGALETNGVDASVMYAFATPIGDWQANVAATWVNEYWASEAPGAPAVNRVGIANTFGTIPEWHGVVGLGWQYGAWNAAGTVRYIDTYADAVGLSAVGNGRRIPSQTYTDLQFGWRSDETPWAGSAPLSGIVVTVGVVNVFDKEPPFSSVAGSLGFDTSQADLRQRFGYFNVSKRF